MPRKTHNSKTRSALFQENIRSIQKQRPVAENQADAQRIDKICTTLAQADTGRRLLDWAEKHDIKIAFDDQITTGTHGFYIYDTVILSPHRKDSDIVSTLAHELRHAWQDHQGFIPNHLHIPPEDALIQYRLVEADAFTHQIRVCDELNQKGITPPLTQLREDPDNYTPYKHAIDSYMAHMQKSDHKDDPKKAMRAAFCGWLHSPACQIYDGQTLSHYDGRLGQQTTDSSPDGQSFSPHKHLLQSRFLDIDLSDGLAMRQDGLNFKHPESLAQIFETMDGTNYGGVLLEQDGPLKPYLNPERSIDRSLSSYYIYVLDQYEDWKYGTLPSCAQKTIHPAP